MDELFRLTLRIEEPREEIDWQRIAAETKRPLSPEARAILRPNSSADLRETLTAHIFGLPLPSAAGDEPIAKLAKRASAARVEKFENGWTVEYADDGSVVRGFAAGVDPEVAFGR